MGIRPRTALARERATVIGCALLYLLFTFFKWQHFTVTIAVTVRYGFNEWHGVGVIACVLVVVLLGWETARLLGVHVPIASISSAFVSLALAMFLLLFTVLTFVSRSDGRNWPAWAGLALSLVIAIAAVLRAKAEGVEILRVTPPEAKRAGSREP